MIAVDLSNQQVLNVDPEAIQQINITADINIAGRTKIYFFLEKSKETILEFSQENLKVF